MVVYNKLFEGVLNAPSVTDAVDSSIYSLLSFQITVSSINTSVTVRFEGSLSDIGETFFNLDVNEIDRTITSNITQGFLFTNKKKFRRVRVRFVSELGGTDAVLNVLIVGGN